MKSKIFIWSMIVAVFTFMACSKDDPKNPDSNPGQTEQPDKPTGPMEPEPAPKPEPDGPGENGYRVYAYNNTGWSQLNLYIYGQVNNLNGVWPGMLPSGSTIIGGYDFLYYDMGLENTGLAEILIFNNNGADQLNDFSYTITKDIYLEVTTEYVGQIDPDNFIPSTTGNEGTAVTTMTVYEANPRFFATNNCLNALTGNLQRISDLGCDVVWIMPICEPSTAPQAIGSPYCIKNYDVINPQYGTVADLQNLVSTAHGLGMKVVLDWVPNHTGWDNPWVTEHPDWFLQKNGQIVAPPGTGWNDVAQLDYSNPAVATAMGEAIKYWVTTADIDGIRFDYADSPYITPAFWTTVAKDLRAMKNDFILLAESSSYIFYNYGFDMIYDWGSAPAISKGFLTSNASSIVEEAEKAIRPVPDGDSILRYIFNHDVMSENSIDGYYGSIDALPAAYVCSAMLNGTPLIYSGMDATGLTGKQSFFNYKVLTFSDTYTSIYGAINKAFKNTADVRGGNLQNYSTNTVLCFTRSTSDKTLLVVVNTSKSSDSINTPASLAGENMTDLINGGNLTLNASIQLGAYEYLILEK